MSTLALFVDQILLLSEEKQSYVLSRVLAKFGQYPLGRFKMWEFELIHDVRRARVASPEQWVGLLAIGLDFEAYDKELVEILGEAGKSS